MTMHERLVYLDNIFQLLAGKLPVNSDLMFFICCQSALETNFGTSNIYKVNLNLFGMKYPRKRMNMALNEKNNHANYYSYNCSVLDYIYWLSYNRPSCKELSSLDGYISFLKRVNYCPSPTYTDSILDIYNQYYVQFFYLFT